jgi:DNA polymerase III subunit delta
LAELAAACQQLMQDSASQITEELVDNYYGGRVETSSYKVADAAVAGQSAKALSLLRHLVASGGDPVSIVIAFSSTMRRMAKAFGNRSATAGDLGIPPWALEQVRRNLNGWTEDGMARVINAVTEADAAAKGGHRDPVFVLEQLVLLIAKKGLA